MIALGDVAGATQPTTTISMLLPLLFCSSCRVPVSHFLRAGVPATPFQTTFEDHGFIEPSSNSTLSPRSFLAPTQAVPLHLPNLLGHYMHLAWPSWSLTPLWSPNPLVRNLITKSLIFSFQLGERSAGVLSAQQGLLVSKDGGNKETTSKVGPAWAHNLSEALRHTAKQHEATQRSTRSTAM